MDKAHISNDAAIVNAAQVKTGGKENDLNTQQNDAVSSVNNSEMGSDLNLHISDDSNQHSESYEYIDYDPENALDFAATNVRYSECDDSLDLESSDKEHSCDDSESTEQIEGISSYEELTSQDELESGGKLATIMNIDTQMSKDSSSTRVVTDVMYAQPETQPKTEHNSWESIQGQSKQLVDTPRTFKAAKCIQFTDDATSSTDMKPLFNEMDHCESPSISDSFESHLQKAKDKQNCIEQKMKNLLKSLMILNVRNMAKHMSNEVATLHEYVYNVYNTKSECNRDYVQNFHDYSSMLTEIQNYNSSQETAWARQKYQNKYFGAGSSANQVHPKCVAQPLFPPLDPKESKNIKDACAQFSTQLHLLETTMDSEATESSSSDESVCGDYTNEYQKQLPLSKRTSTQIRKLENSYASRMRWIQLHVSFLEVQKKYHDYIHMVIQTMKSNLRFIDNDSKESVSVNTISNVPEDQSFSCARIRPLDVHHFKKRKLVQTQNLHTVSKLAAQTTSIKCGCQWPYQPCALCTGRVDPTAPRLPNDCLDLQNRLALLDPGMHPNLSVLSEVHQNIHFNAIMKMPEWQAKMIRCGPRIKTLLAATSAADRRMLKEELKHDRPRKFVKKSNIATVKPMKHGFKKRGRKPSSSKSGKRRKIPDLDDHCDSSLSTNMSEESQNVTWPKETSRQAQRSTSFDIDNMVIPYGVPVSTKVQVLPYKEIITPKWRVVNYEPLTGDDVVDAAIMNHESATDPTKARSCPSALESDEDVSEENCLKRHMRCLLEERKKFGVYTKFSWTTRSRANRRLESKTMDMMPVTPQSEHTSESELQQGLNETTESPENTEMNTDVMADYALDRITKRKSMQYTNLLNDGDTFSDHNEQPFTPRQFPLTEDDYETMVSVMPAKHTEILSLMQSGEGNDRVLRQSITESENVDMDVTSPFNEVIVQREGNMDDGVLEQFTMTDSEESVTLDDPDDPEWG